MPFSVILGMFPVKSLQRTAGPPFTLPPRREGTLPPVSSRRATDRTGGGGRSFARRNTQRPRFYLIFRDGTLPADPHRRKLTAASGPGRGGAEEAVRGLGPPLSRSDPRSRDPSAAQGPSSRDAAPPPSAAPVAVAMTTRTARRQTPTFHSRRSESPRLYHVGQPPFPRAVRNFLPGALARAAALPWERGGEVAAGPGPGPGPGGDPCAPERGEERAGLRGWVWCRLL